MKIVYLKYSLLLAVIFMFSCSSYNKVLKKGSYAEKYSAAKNYYNEGDYYKAEELFNAIAAESYGKPEADTIHFLSAQCLFKQEAYYEAAEQFKLYVQKYPRSSLVEEAYFLYAKCSYNTSAPKQLDQETTKNAINVMENFILRYPSSTYVKDCQTKIKELNSRLEEKAFNQCLLYFKTENYRAAVVSFNYFIKDYPESASLDEVYFKRFKAQFLFGKESLEVYKKDGKTYFLKKDRLNEAKSFYYDYIDKFGKDAKNASDAEKINVEIEEQLKTLSNK